jgi:hypothetical protein
LLPTCPRKRPTRRAIGGAHAKPRRHVGRSLQWCGEPGHSVYPQRQVPKL